MEIRTATTDDKVLLTELALDFWPMYDFPTLLLEINQLLVQEDTVISIAVEAEKIIAFALGKLRNDDVEGAQSSPVGYLEGIYVSTPYRRHGIARRLAAYLEQWDRDHGCQEFASDVEQKNEESLIFHNKAGFQEVNRIVCFIKSIK